MDKTAPKLALQMRFELLSKYLQLNNLRDGVQPNSRFLQLRPILTSFFWKSTNLFYLTLSIKEGLTLLTWKFSTATRIIVDCRDFWKTTFQKDLHPVYHLAQCAATVIPIWQQPSKVHSRQKNESRCIKRQREVVTSWPCQPSSCYSIAGLDSVDLLSPANAWFLFNYRLLNSGHFNICLLMYLQNSQLDFEKSLFNV